MEPCPRNGCTTSCTETSRTASRTICPEQRCVHVLLMPGVYFVLSPDHVTPVFQICWSAEAALHRLLRFTPASALLCFYILCIYCLSSCYKAVSVSTSGWRMFWAWLHLANKMKLLRHVCCWLFIGMERDWLKCSFVIKLKSLQTSTASMKRLICSALYIDQILHERIKIVHASQIHLNKSASWCHRILFFCLNGCIKSV